MTETSKIESTTRAYTLKLSGSDNWRNLLWETHVTVNRGAQVWGDWLLTLRGALPPTLADDEAILPVTEAAVNKEAKRLKLKGEAKNALRVELERSRRRDLRVLLALSWLSVESPASLVPEEHIVAWAAEPDRADKVMARFNMILDRLQVGNREEWIDACRPALSARIRDDAVWVDRAGCFLVLQQQFLGLTPDWAAGTLFELLGGHDDYFALPEVGAPPAEAKDFVQKALGWLSRNWGSGPKSDSAAIGTRLKELAHVEPGEIIGSGGGLALAVVLRKLGEDVSEDDSAAELFKQLKRAIGWKGRSSKGAMALEKIRDTESVSAELWQQVSVKLAEEAADKLAKGRNGSARPEWMVTWRAQMESRLGMSFRVSRDLQKEYSVIFDHALRRVSAGHTWIKRAEVERRRFREDRQKIESVPEAAHDWLEAFCESRSSDSGAIAGYIIRKRAIDGWGKILQAWTHLGSQSTRGQRIEAARNVQANLEENEKFGDIQLFAGFGDGEDDAPRACLADESATCVWRDTEGRLDAEILRNYVAAAEAKQNERRFKVPAYRHPGSASASGLCRFRQFAVEHHLFGPEGRSGKAEQPEEPRQSQD